MQEIGLGSITPQDLSGFVSITSDDLDVLIFEFVSWVSSVKWFLFYYCYYSCLLMFGLLCAGS